MPKKYKNFNVLRAKLTPDQIRKSEERYQEIVSRMALDELREARHLTQMQLAHTLEKNQGEVSRIERRTDMYISTLRNFIRAMGGELHIRADFPDGSIEITQFEEQPAKIGKPDPGRPPGFPEGSPSPA